jgi:hypothetical protein
MNNTRRKELEAALDKVKSLSEIIIASKLKKK